MFLFFIGNKKKTYSVRRKLRIDGDNCFDDDVPDTPLFSKDVKMISSNDSAKYLNGPINIPNNDFKKEITINNMFYNKTP